MENNSPVNQSPINLPNSSAVLTLGILSIVLCWCHGILGMIMAIIALVLANRDLALLESNPDMYTQNSINNVKTGRTVAIIGLILAVAFLFILIISLIFLGFNFALFPWEMIEEFNY